MKPKRVQANSPLMSFEEAAVLIGGEHGGLHPNTIRQRKGGTESLTHVPGFGRRVFLIRVEVMELIEEKINQAKAIQRKNFRLVKKAI